jgi:hypothetical protein
MEDFTPKAYDERQPYLEKSKMSTLPATLPRLTSFGKELDLSPEAFGELESSMHLVDDIEALRTRMDEDGYLYLPGYLDRDEVLAARDEVARRLEEESILDPSYPREELVAREGAQLNFTFDRWTKGNAPLMKVLYDGAMMEFYTRFLGGPVRHFDYTWFRAVTPGRSAPPHMDIVYMGRGTHDLFTAWTPLRDIPLEIGGLMILEKSHRHERLNKNYGQKDVDKFCVNKRGENYTGMGGGGNVRAGGMLSDKPHKLRANLGGRWLTTEYSAGDLLTFTMNTIHASLDNQSNRVRISSDSRYQLASEPADERWIGENPIAHGPEAKRGMIC